GLHPPEQGRPAEVAAGEARPRCREVNAREKSSTIPSAPAPQRGSFSCLLTPGAYLTFARLTGRILRKILTDPIRVIVKHSLCSVLHLLTRSDRHVSACIYPDRIVGCDCDHCSSDWLALARRAESARSGGAREVPE